MTKRDFFRILIKLFGLYSATLTFFNLIPANLSTLLYGFEMSAVYFILGAIIVILLLLYLLLFKTDKIIDLLKLDIGFDEDRIQFENLNSNSIIQLSIIIIAGFMIIDNIPVFLSNCYYAYKSSSQIEGMNGIFSLLERNKVDYFRWTVSGINIALGFILLLSRKGISNWLTQKKEIIKD